MNRSGFTTVEVLIASALIITLITGGAVGMRQVNLLAQVAATRTSHTEMRTRIFEAVSDSQHCADNLRADPVTLTSGVLTKRPVATLPDFPPIVLRQVNNFYVQNPAAWNTTDPNMVVERDKLIDGVKYSLTLRFPTDKGDDFVPGDAARPPASRRMAELVVSGERTNLADQQKSLHAPGTTQTSAPVVSVIPLTAEFDRNTGEMISCTVLPDDIEEVLAFAPFPTTRHTVRDCIRIGGTPMPVDEIGMICRVPNQLINEPGNIHRQPSCPVGWVNASLVPKPGPINTQPYSATKSVDLTISTCKGKKYVNTAWHTMGQFDPQHGKDTRKIKKGTGKFLSFMGAGGKFAGAFVSFVLLGAIGVIIFLLLTSGCKSDTIDIYPQLIATGCV